MKLTVGPLPPAVYWRRRVFVLAALLVLVFAISYACRGPSASSDTGQNPAAVTTTTTPPASPTTTAQSPDPSPSLTPTVDVSTPPAASGSPGLSGECADSELTVTVAITSTSPTATRLIYGGTYTIRLAVANSSKRVCTRDVGSVPEELIVKQGATKIWSSDDCASPARIQHDVRTFHPGDVVVATIQWSSYYVTTNGCAKGARPAPLGTYQLTGRVDTKFSKTVSFTIQS